MNDFIISEFNGQTIRTTENGRFSVFDVLVAFGVSDKKQNAKNVLDRISGKHSEVSLFCSNFKFPGRGQRETPVADESGIYQILMLCPGQRGAEFRKWASQLVERYRKADGTLAEDIVKRQTTEDAKRTAQRIDGIAKRKELTDVLKVHGVENGKEFGICTNKTYTGLYEKSAKELKTERGLTKTASLRDNMTSVELAALSFAESLAAQEIETKDIYGVKSCSNACYTTASDVRSVLTKYQKS